MREIRTSGSVGARRAIDGGLPDQERTIPVTVAVADPAMPRRAGAEPH